MSIKHIKLVFTMDDDSRVTGHLSREYDERWGAPRERLAECVEPMEELSRIMHELDAWTPDEDD